MRPIRRVSNSSWSPIIWVASLELIVRSSRATAASTTFVPTTAGSVLTSNGDGMCVVSSGTSGPVGRYTGASVPTAAASRASRMPATVARDVTGVTPSVQA